MASGTTAMRPEGGAKEAALAGSAAVSVVGVRKQFEVTKALDGASFHATLGEVHAIFGGNGSGKSTLAKVISGVLPIDAGQVNILSHTPGTPHEARAIGVATVFQEVLVADESSILDNLYLGADRLFSRVETRAAKLKRAETLMSELSGLNLDLDAPAGMLPLNLKAWITIGRALLTQPKILILDESSAALDLDSTERLFRKIRELREAGSCVLIVTHRIAEMIRIADRVTVLRDGKDVGVLSKGDITEANLLALMAGKSGRLVKSGERAEDARGQALAMKADALKLWPHSREVEFRLHRGEIVGVAGLDGHGQSDFVRVLAGVQRAYSSEPTVVGERGGFHPIRNIQDAAREKVNYVSGDRKKEGIFANLSIFENMMAPLYRLKSRGGRLGLIDWPALTGAFEWEREKLSIKMGDRGDKITSLSGGNQQKVLIGRAFALSPNILILNDPARGVDIGAKTDLYGHLRAFAAAGKSVVYMSSEIEELIGFCSRVLVFRHGHVFAELVGDEIEGERILASMFGQHVAAGAVRRQEAAVRVETDEPASNWNLSNARRWAREAFTLTSPAFAPGGVIPERYAESNLVSPPLAWEGAPEGARAFALTVTDPDVPEAFGFPRAFAHWLVADIPADARRLPEDASRTTALPAGAREFASDFVTFGIPGYGRGYGGPWPPDDAHRYLFTLYALKTDKLDLDDAADYLAFLQAVAPQTINVATLVGVYGPARAALPGVA
jgi:ribose transport system ATP-binding protein